MAVTQRSFFQDVVTKNVANRVKWYFLGNGFQLNYSSISILLRIENCYLVSSATIKISWQLYHSKEIMLKTFGVYKDQGKKFAMQEAAAVLPLHQPHHEVTGSRTIAQQHQVAECT